MTLEWIVGTLTSLGFFAWIFKKGKQMWIKRNERNSVIDYISSNMEKHDKAHSNIQDGLNVLKKANLSIIREKLSTKHACLIERGYIYSHERESYQHMFDMYKKLGGNGFVDQLKEEIDSLETKNPS